MEKTTVHAQSTKPLPQEKTSLFQKLNQPKLIFIGLLIILLVGGILIRSTKKPSQISQLIKANEKAAVTFKEATVDIPKDTIKKDSVVAVKTVAAPKLNSPDFQYASQTYEFTSSQKLEKPVVITLKYDPAKLPDPSYEDYLYIGVWENGQWVPLEGGMINKTDHSLSTAVEHFSLYSILTNLKKDLGEIGGKAFNAWFENKIEQISYEQLPNEVANNVGYSKSDIYSIQKVQVALVTKITYLTEVVATNISKVTSILIASQESEKELQEALESTTASEIISGGGAAGELTLKAYALSEGGQIAYELATKGIQVAQGVKSAASLTTVYAQAIAWVLDVEMDYINKNIEPAFKDIWTLGSPGERLTLYIVYIDAPYKDNQYTKGIRYYYWDKASGKYINYFNNLVSITSEFTKTGEETKKITPSPQVTLPISPSPQVKTTTGITTVSEFNKLPPGDYGCGEFPDDPKKPITMELTINSYDGLYYLYYDFYKAKDSTGEVDIAVQHRDLSAPDFWQVPSTKLEIGKNYILIGCKPYIGTGGPGEGPIVFGVREDWEGSIVEKK